MAELRFDLACLSLATGERRSHTGFPVLAGPSGRLELDHARRPVEAQGAYCPLRAVRGTLQPVGWWAPAIAVDLELLPWSATRSELALIAGPARWSGRLDERRHLRLAHDVLDVLVDTVHAAGDVAEAAEKPAVGAYRRTAS